MTVTLHQTVDGPADGPTLVLGGSLGATVAMWQPQMAALTERFRVIRYDHRGHGESPVPAGLAAAIPGARMAIVPDAAHLANVEQPEAVTRLLLDFLGGCLDGR